MSDNTLNPMESKTQVEMISDDQQYNDWKAGEIGYIDGYCRGGDNVPHAVVVFKDRVVLVPTTVLRPIKKSQ